MLRQRAIDSCRPAFWRDALEKPITLEKLQIAVNKRGGNKAPGRDGMCLEFFKATWGFVKGNMLALFNQMFMEGKISEKQKSGIIVCIPKTKGPTVPTDYRPVTLLNNDYKILDRIIANQIRPTLVDVLH
jgi:hypothetical protein